VYMKGMATNDAVTTNSSGNTFRIIRNADGTFRIMPAGESYAKVSNAIGVNSNYASIQEYSNINSMKWTFEPVVNRFYSEYTPEKFPDATDLHSFNCYGYAFRHIVYGGMQEPGDFASLEDKASVISSIRSDNADESLNKIIFNMELDAKRLGYSLTEYVPTNNKIEQFGSNSRLIAVITPTDGDFHFYMQHNDGTWSHKPGIKPITDKAFSSTDSNPIYLNNDNINYYIADGKYNRGSWKFFIITRDAVYDYPHDSLLFASSELIELYYKDMAGDNMFTASNISIGTKEACFDFYYDVDFFVLNSSTTRVYTITTTCDADYDIECEIYDYNGELIVSNTTVGQVNARFSVYAGKNYFIKLYNHDNLPGEYTITLS